MVNKNVNLKKNLGYPQEILTPNDDKLNMEKSGMLEGNILSSKTIKTMPITFYSEKLEVFSRLF